MQLFSIRSSYQLHVKRGTWAERVDTIPVRVLAQVLLINFHLLSPLWSRVASRRIASPPLAAYRCQVQRINQTNWERTDDDDDEWGLRATNCASERCEYPKDTHDSKQLQCAARIIIYMRCDCECVCVRVVQFKVSLDNVNIIIQLEPKQEQKNSGISIPPARSFPSNCAGFRQRLTGPTLPYPLALRHQNPRKQSTAFALEIEDRRSKIVARRAWRTGVRASEIVEDRRARSHIVTQSNSMPSMSLSISTTWLDIKKNHAQAMKRSPLCNAPHYSFPTLLQHARVNTDALTALNQIFDYFDLEVLQTPQCCVRPAHPLIKPKSRSQQQLKLTRTHTHTHYKYLLGTMDSGPIITRAA